MKGAERGGREGETNWRERGVEGAEREERRHKRGHGVEGGGMKGQVDGGMKSEREKKRQKDRWPVR